MSKALREKLAHALWLREAERVGPPSTIAGRTPEAFRDSSADNQERWLHYADAVLSVLGSLVEDEETVAAVKRAVIAESCHDETFEEMGETVLHFVGCGSHSADAIARAAIRALTEQSNDRT